jgi:hypothetical protein
MTLTQPGTILQVHLPEWHADVLLEVKPGIRNSGLLWDLSINNGDSGGRHRGLYPAGGDLDGGVPVPGPDRLAGSFANPAEAARLRFEYSPSHASLQHIFLNVKLLNFLIIFRLSP